MAAHRRNWNMKRHWRWSSARLTTLSLSVPILCSLLTTSSVELASQVVTLLLQGRRTLGPWPPPAAAARKLRGPHPMQLCGLVFWQVSEQRVSTLANNSAQARCCFRRLMKLKLWERGCTVPETRTCFVYITGHWKPHGYEVKTQNI